MLEVAPTAASIVVSGGGKVWAVGEGEVAIMDTSTGVSLLYTHTASLRFRHDFPNNDTFISQNVDAGWYAGGSAWFASRGGGLLNVTPTGVATVKTVPGLTGDTGNPYYAYWAGTSVVVVDDIVWGVWSTPTSVYYGYHNTTTDTVSSNASGNFTSGFGVVGAHMYGVSGSTLTQYTKTGTATGSTWTFPQVPTSRPSMPVGTVLWYKTATGMIAFDATSGTFTGVAATPTWTAPNARRPRILDGVAYWINDDNTTMTAFKLADGQWKADSLATTRGWRSGIGVGSGKLWIPSPKVT